MTFGRIKLQILRDSYFVLLLLILSMNNAFSQSWQGGKIAFYSRDIKSETELTESIYMMNTDGSDLTKLMEINKQDGNKNYYFVPHLSLSPDCRKVAMEMDTYLENVSSNEDIIVFEIDNNRIVNLTNGMFEACRDPRWSPNGKQIAFMCANNLPMICIMNSDGSNIRTFGEVKSMYQHPDWSPDGKKIVFARNWTDIYVMDADGSNIQKIIETPVEDRIAISWLRWSPDGKRFLFTSSKGMYIIDSDGNNLRLIVENSGASLFGCWSPDGKMILFGLEEEIGKPMHLWYFNIENDVIKRLTNNERFEANPDWKDIGFFNVKAGLLLKKAGLWGNLK